MAGRSKLVREEFRVPPVAEPPPEGKDRPAIRARKASAQQAEKTPKLSKPRRVASRAGKKAAETLTTARRKEAASRKAATEPKSTRPIRDRGFDEKGKRGQPKHARVSTTRAKTRSGTAKTKPRVQKKEPTR